MSYRRWVFDSSCARVLAAQGAVSEGRCVADTYERLRKGVIGRAMLDVNSSDATNLHISFFFMLIVSILSLHHRSIPPYSRRVDVLFRGLLGTPNTYSIR